MISTTIKNILTSILKAEFVLRMNLGQYFIHVIYTFFLFTMIIWFSLAVETTMSKVEKNKQEIKELEFANAQKKYDVVRLSSRQSVNALLKKMGSNVNEATVPAKQLVK